MSEPDSPMPVRDNMPLGETVFQALCRALREGIYRPGDRLREDEIARSLNVSRTPVREAFGRLLARRLVEPLGARGLVVRSLDQSEVLELYAIREILEGAAARLAAQYASLPEIDAMHDQHASLCAAVGDAAELARINRLFHSTIIRASRNRYLDHALQEMQDSIALLGTTTFSAVGRPKLAIPEHAEIIEAIQARDPDRAEQAARAHIRAALRARLGLQLLS